MLESNQCIRKLFLCSRHFQIIQQSYRLPQLCFPVLLILKPFYYLCPPPQHGRPPREPLQNQFQPPVSFFLLLIPYMSATLGCTSREGAREVASPQLQPCGRVTCSNILSNSRISHQFGLSNFCTMPSSAVFFLVSSPVSNAKILTGVYSRGRRDVAAGPLQPSGCIIVFQDSVQPSDSSPMFSLIHIGTISFSKVHH